MVAVLVVWIAGRVPVITQASLEVFIKEKAQADGKQSKIFGEIADYLFAGGLKAAIAGYEYTAADGRSLTAPFHKNFKDFAEVMKVKRFPLYVESPHPRTLQRKASVPAKFFE